MFKPKAKANVYQHLFRVILPGLCIILLITAFPPAACLAQTNRLQTLLEKLRTAKHDTDRVNAFYSLSRLYWEKNTDSALLFAQKSLELAQKIHFEKGIALAYLTKGVCLVSQGKLPEALDCHFNCLRISEKLGLDGLSGNEYGNIGIVYADLGDYAKALYYYQQCYNVALKQHTPFGYGTFSPLVNIGEVFKKKAEYDSAIAYTERALVIAKKVHDSTGIATAMYNIAENYILQKQYPKAGTYLYEALSIAKKANDDEDVAYCHNGLALTCYYIGKYDSSMLYAETDLMESKKLGIVDLIKTAYHVLYLTNQRAGNYKKALYCRDNEVALNDSLSTVAKEKAIKNIQSSYDLEKKQEQIDLLNKDNIIKEKELEGVKLRRDILTVGLVVLLSLAFILFRNYSQKKKLSEQLKKQNKNILQQNQHLEELVQVRNKLFSIIGHDLRGPVHSIRDMMDMIKANILSVEESGYFIEKASENLAYTGHLLDNLLYWAKSQMDGMQVNPLDFEVEKIIAQNITLLKSNAAEKQVSIVKGAITVGMSVYGDEAMIDIVVRNLVQNAVKFSNAGGLVTVAATEKVGHAVISVTDTGLGIPTDVQNKIFDKFSSHTTFGTAKEKGSGLGLLLCKEMVEKNNGTIWFTSQPGEGSIFYFTVPLNKPAC